MQEAQNLTTKTQLKIEEIMINNNLKTIVKISMMLAPMISYSADTSSHWTYSGKNGPKEWPQHFKECRGEHQSPINLNSSANLNSKKPDIIFHYDDYKVADNTHTIQVDDNQSRSINIGDKTYNLIQFHFHIPSEHTIDGKSYAMELHFVHKDDNNNLAVLGVLIKEGKSNNFIKDILASTDKSKKSKFSLEDDNIMDLFPKNKEYYHYLGSLTTPPCSEGVNWYVFKNPIEASKEEISEFQKILKSNARPVQELNDRKVK